MADAERERRKEAAADRAALATTTELVNGAVDDLDGLRGAVVELQREVEERQRDGAMGAGANGAAGGTGGGAGNQVAVVEGLVREVAELRRSAGAG